jgi:hypothetical protein
VCRTEDFHREIIVHSRARKSQVGRTSVQERAFKSVRRPSRPTSYATDA